MAYISKEELKQQLKKMGIVVKGNYIEKSMVTRFLTKIQANKKTFADYLFEEMEEAKKEVAGIETAVRNEFKDRPEISILQEIAFRIMKKDNKIPNWIKSKAMDAYNKMK